MLRKIVQTSRSLARSAARRCRSLTSSVRAAIPASGFSGRHRQIAVFCICTVLAGWTWWDAQVGGYAGLPVNTLAQIVGDLILMGLLAPLARHRRRKGRRDHRHDETTGVRTLLQRLSDATHRIQVLDSRICLPPLDAMPAVRNGHTLCDRAAFRTELGGALKAALDNDVCVEILLPDPESPCSCSIARRLGIEPGFYRQSLSLLLDDLDSVSRDAQSGRLDLRLYTEPATVSIVRCDEWIWASLDPDGASDAPGYLEVDQGCENGRTLQAYFNRLHAAAHIPARGRRSHAAQDPRRRPGIERAHALAIQRGANAKGPPGPAAPNVRYRQEADALVSLEGSARW